MQSRCLFAIWGRGNSADYARSKPRFVTPFGLNRWTILFLYYFMNALTAYAYYGWVKGLEDMLFRGGAYRWACSSEEITAIGDDRPLCNEQQRLVGNLMTVSVVSAIVSALVAGSLLDTVGPKITGTTGIALSIMGWVLLAVSGEGFVAYVPAMASVGAGCNILCLSALTVANLFPEKKRAIIAGNTTASCLSMFVFIICNAAWKNFFPHVSFSAVVGSYAAVVAVVCLPIALLLLPWKHFGASEESNKTTEMNSVVVESSADDRAESLPTLESMRSVSTAGSVNDNKMQENSGADGFMYEREQLGDVRTCDEVLTMKQCEEGVGIPMSDSSSVLTTNDSFVAAGNAFESAEGAEGTPRFLAVYGNRTCAENEGLYTDFEPNSSSGVKEPFLVATGEKCEDDSSLETAKAYEKEGIDEADEDTTDDAGSFTAECYVDFVVEPLTVCGPQENGVYPAKDIAVPKKELGANNESIGDSFSQEEIASCAEVLRSCSVTSSSLSGSREQRSMSPVSQLTKVMCCKRSGNLPAYGTRQCPSELSFVGSLKQPLYWVAVVCFGLGLLRGDFLYKTAFWHLGETVYGVLGYLMPCMGMAAFIMGLLSQKFGVLFGLWTVVTCGALSCVGAMLGGEWAAYISLFCLWIHQCYIQTSTIIFIFELYPPKHSGKLLGIAFLIGGLISLIGIPMYNTAIAEEAYLTMDVIILICCLLCSVGVAYITHAQWKPRTAVLDEKSSSKSHGTIGTA